MTGIIYEYIARWRYVKSPLNLRLPQHTIHARLYTQWLFSWRSISPIEKKNINKKQHLAGLVGKLMLKYWRGNAHIHNSFPRAHETHAQTEQRRYIA